MCPAPRSDILAGSRRCRLSEIVHASVASVPARPGPARCRPCRLQAADPGSRPARGRSRPVCRHVRRRDRCQVERTFATAGSTAGCSSTRSRHPDRRPRLRRRDRRPQRRGPRRSSSTSASRCWPNSTRSTPASSRARTRSTPRSCATSCATTSGACETLQSWAWDPQVYNSLAGGALYTLMARDFAPMPQRLQVRHRAHGEDPGAVRADAREPRPGARAEDPRRDRGQAERRRAQPDRRPDRCRNAGELPGRGPQAPRRRDRRRCARPSPSTRRGSTRPWCRTPRATSASARSCTTRSSRSR